MQNTGVPLSTMIIRLSGCLPQGDLKTTGGTQQESIEKATGELKNGL